MNVNNIQVKVLESGSAEELENQINDVITNLAENMIVLDTKYNCACGVDSNLYSVLIMLGEIITIDVSESQELIAKENLERE